MDHGPWPCRVLAVAGQNLKLHGSARVAAVLAAALTLTASAALSVVAAPADYPSRTIRIITPLAAGSASDIVLRILAEKLSDQFKLPVIVQNQPGAGGVVADHTIVNASADGYTIGWIGNNNAIGVSCTRMPSILVPRCGRSSGSVSLPICSLPVRHRPIRASSSGSTPLAPSRTR